MDRSEARPTCVDRATLYEELWQTPGTKLARKYGISDVALGKACRRHNIPRPPVGYWTLVRHGYEVKRTPLPALTDHRLQQVEFNPLPKLLSSAMPARTPIDVPEHLSSPHPLVEEARKVLRSTRGDDRRIVRADPEKALDIAVAASSITRALRIMNALIRAWEEAGGTVTRGVKGFQGHGTAFVMGPDQVFAALTERTEPLPNWKPPKDSYYRRYPPRRPSGCLVFSIDYYQGVRLRSTWSDGKRQRLEDMLDRVVEGLMVHVADKKRRRLDDECEERQSAAAEERRTAKQRRDDEEKQRREALTQDLNRWGKAKQIRSYVSAMREAAERGILQTSDEESFGQWIEWAEWYADHIDPLVRAEPRPAVVETPENKPLHELDLTSRARPVLAALGVVDCDALSKVTEKQIREVQERYSHLIWSEICRVLEGHGYKVSKRQYW